MKKYSAISEMYYGNRGSCGNINLNEEENESLTRLIDRENKFLEKIKNNKPVLDAYEKLSDEQCEQNALNNEHFYKEGFKFGFLMALDVLCDK